MMNAGAGKLILTRITASANNIIMSYFFLIFVNSVFEFLFVGSVKYILGIKILYTGSILYLILKGNVKK